MVRKRPLKERIIDSALLVISIVVIIFALAMMAQITIANFYIVPFLEFFTLFILGIVGFRLWLKETR
ncbi:MAG: hypothetical protein ACTSU5_05665 [Promethearchaeota archaeon]